MKNVFIILVLLFLPFGIAIAFSVDTSTAGRLGVAAVFSFTSIGHFLLPNQMKEMIPSLIPAREAIVLLSGILEALLAFLILVPRYAGLAGLVAILFLFLATPLNIYAAFKRISFGGHGQGPTYLWVRIPLQILLMTWIYWFSVRVHS